MISTFMIFVISILLRVFMGEFVKLYPKFDNWITPINYIVIGCAVLFLTFTVIKIVKEIKA